MTEPPVGGLCTELVEKEAIIFIDNNVPRPLVQLELTQSQVKQTTGDVRSEFKRYILPYFDEDFILPNILSFGENCIFGQNCDFLAEILFLAKF